MMKDGLLPFQIPILGLELGPHSYHYICNDEFFASFEKTLVESGAFEVELELEKNANDIEMNFSISGFLHTDCDRCTAAIRLPLSGEAELVLKYGEKESEDNEIIFITRDRDSYNVADFIHESIELLMPFSNTYDCENDDPMPCDFKVLNLLEEQAKKIKTKKEENPVWDSLKDLNLDN